MDSTLITKWNHTVIIVLIYLGSELKLDLRKAILF